MEELNYSNEHICMGRAHKHTFPNLKKALNSKALKEYLGMVSLPYLILTAMTLRIHVLQTTCLRIMCEI